MLTNIANNNTTIGVQHNVTNLAKQQHTVLLLLLFDKVPFNVQYGNSTCLTKTLFVHATITLLLLLSLLLLLFFDEKLTDCGGCNVINVHKKCAIWIFHFA